jgi:hypothetical protein
MGVAAGGLALCSFNLLARFQANFSLLLTYGAMAVCSRAASTGCSRASIARDSAVSLDRAARSSDRLPDELLKVAQLQSGGLFV